MLLESTTHRTRAAEADVCVLALRKRTAQREHT
jgi:hypothetical protein